MLSDATLTADIIKQFAKNAFDSTMPFSFHYGTVKSTDPIEIEVEQKLILTENDLIFTTLVQDFDVDMYMEHTTEKTDLIHNHEATTVAVGNAMMGQTPLPFVDTGSKTTIQNSSDEHNHLHEYKGVKTFTVNLKLAKDEKVLLLRIQGGQKFLVLDRVRTLNDTEFTDEFEGSGSSGSSGSGSDSGNTSGGGSGGSTDSGGGNSGSTDSGNGGNDSGSTDNENPDTGDNGNNPGGSVSDVISVTALMTALLSLTDEQKKEIGLTGVTIDDENITDSSTWSSQKIQDSVNANTFEISKLNETTELSGECCIPIVQGSETKKIKVDTLQSELNDKINSLENTIPTTIASEISKIVAEAPENFDTLKEMSDWITEHEDSASAMNSAIQSNKTDIETEIAERKSANTSLQSNIDKEATTRANADTSLQNQINNKADANHTHTSIKRTEIASGTDLNNLKTPGEYFAIDNVTYTNAPCNNFTMQVIQLMSSYIFQIVYAYSSNKIYTRSYIYGGASAGRKWTSWKEFISTTDIDTSMNTESTNPVQNKVVSTMINTLSTDLNTLATQVGAMNGGYACAYACETATGTTAKTITIEGFELKVGACIKVVFKYGNGASKPTLNVNKTGAKEIRINKRKNGSYQNLSLNDTDGFYTWNYYTTLDLFYDGNYWIVLGNPVVCNNTGISTTPQYRICIDGYKEIRGTYYYGNISSKKDINVTISLPLALALMEPTYCHVSLTARHSAESYPQSGEEMTYYISSSSLKIHFFNRNESTTMNGVSFDWMIQGY